MRVIALTAGQGSRLKRVFYSAGVVIGAWPIWRAMKHKGQKSLLSGFVGNVAIQRYTRIVVAGASTPHAAVAAHSLFLLYSFGSL